MSKPPKKNTTESLTPTSTELPIAGVIRRLSALVYDAFLLFGLLVAPLFIATAVMSPRQNLPQGSVAHELPAIAPQPVLLAYMIVVIVGFYVYFWRKSGQTLAMQAWRIRVDSNVGGRPTWKQCFVRAAVGFISLLCGGLGYWWIWIDKDGASWHDRASNTRVVVIPKK
ncbi:MAG: RDD family protein [Spongiibacteraceae bacterium]